MYTAVECSGTHNLRHERGVIPRLSSQIVFRNDVYCMTYLATEPTSKIFQVRVCGAAEQRVHPLRRGIRSTAFCTNGTRCCTSPFEEAAAAQAESIARGDHNQIAAESALCYSSVLSFPVFMNETMNRSTRTRRRPDISSNTTSSLPCVVGAVAVVLAAATVGCDGFTFSARPSVLRGSQQRCQGCMTTTSMVASVPNVGTKPTSAPRSGAGRANKRLHVQVLLRGIFWSQI